MRTIILSALMLLGASAFAATPPVDAPVLGAGPAPAASKPANNADEDEDEAPKAATPKTAPTTPPPPTQGAVTPEAAPAAANQQKLVSGAPLYNPNVAVHIVEKKETSDKNRLEVVLQPSLQVNGKFTQHYGVGGSVVWHLHENFGLMVMGLWNYYTTESSFNGELINKVRAEAQAATSVLLNGGVIGGVEAQPFYGKFVWYENNLIHFSLVINGGAGAGSTRLQLKPFNDCSNSQSACFPDPTYGDMGWRFMAEIGGGFRVQLGKWVAIRLELRDLLYSARVDSVNGCSGADLKAMDAVLTAGMPVNKANVSASCNLERFEGTDSNGRSRALDVPLAFGLVKTPSSDVLNNVGLYLGISGNFF